MKIVIHMSIAIYTWIGWLSQIDGGVSSTFQETCNFSDLVSQDVWKGAKQFNP
jgi:hypothetical protein